MNYIYQKWWFKLLIWGGIFSLHFSMSNHFQNIKIALMSAGYATLSMYIWHLLTITFLIPLHKKGNKSFLYIAITSLVIVAIITCAGEIMLIDKYKFQDHEPPPHIFFYLRQIFVLGFVFLMDHAFNLIEQTNILKENQKILSEEKLKTELKLLKAQINPHFIFNALNNIYSLSYMQSEKAPESVLKLSEMLRYVFYDCSKDRVNVNSEIKYIRNFTAFQQMKSEEMQNIMLTIQLKNSLTEVAPMLFIPFIENAFKYSRIEEYKEAFVKINITQKEDTLIFYICNNIPTDNIPLSGSGMGIKNVQHRLDIIYPNKYQLDIKTKDNQYIVQLALKI